MGVPWGYVPRKAQRLGEIRQGRRKLVKRPDVYNQDGVSWWCSVQHHTLANGCAEDIDVEII